MAHSPIRYKRLLQALPKHNYKVKPAAIEAGFTEMTADKQGKKLLHNAMKYEARELADRLENSKPAPISQAKQTMAELIGMTREDVMNNVKYLATQEKDLGVRHKVIAPLAKEYGITLQSEEKSNVTVPVLNVTVKQNEDMAQPSRIIDEHQP